jgi:hypothetical protein
MNVNTSRVLLGGLLAGLCINIGEFILNTMVVAKDWEATMAGLGKSPVVTTNQIIAFNIWGFLMGIAAVWIYAAIRPRYGAGPRTALKAAGVLWFLGYFMALWPPVILHLFPARVVIISLIWGAGEVLIGTLAGAKIYQEEGAAGLRTTTARV